MNVKFQNLALVNEPHLPVWESKFKELVKNSQFVLGDEVKSFEKNFSSYIGVKHCIATNSGTSALIIALRALKLKHTDLQFIAVPAMTFVASIEAIIIAGLRPVLIDVTPSGGMDFEKLKKIRLSQQVDAVLVVHLCGSAVEIPDLDIPVIEDACQSVGSEFQDGTKTGSKGIISAFSYYPSKNLGALGDGGSICTSDTELNDYCRLLRNHGSKEKYIHELTGMTARLDNLQAMFLNTKLSKLDEENDKRRQIASWYFEALLTSDVRNQLEFQTKDPSKHNNFHLFVVKTPFRNELAEYLDDNDIETGLHYPEPLHKMKANLGKFANPNESFPEAEKWSNRCLSLPMHPHMTFEEVTYVCNTIKGFFENRKKQQEAGPRIAYLFDSYLRTFIKTGLNEVITKYPGDVFVYALDTINVGSSEVIDDEYMKQVSYVYPITKYKIDNQDRIWQESKYKDRHYLKGFTTSLYCKSKNYEMMKEYEKEHNVKYDIVVFCRADITLKNYNMDEILTDKDPFIYFSKSLGCLAAGIFGDHIHVCNSETSPLFLNALNKILDDMPGDNSPESYLTTNLLDLGDKIKIKFLEADISYLRLDGGGMDICSGKDTKEFYDMLLRPDLYSNAWNRVTRKT